MGKIQNNWQAYTVNFGFLISWTASLVMDMASVKRREVTNMRRMKMTSKGSFAEFCSQDPRSVDEGLISKFIWNLALGLKKVKRKNWDVSRASSR